MNGRVVHLWKKNRREEVRASLDVFKGRDVADIRVYVADENGEPRPTKKGICIRVDDLPRLRESVESLIAAVEAEAA
jgi:Transcriptional Coactivator p15 (PC4)